MPIAPALWKRAQDAAELLRNHEGTVTVVHHIDADGVTSGGIALEALARAKIPHDSIAVKSMDDFHVLKVKEREAEMLWFCDLGSTVYMQFPQPKVVCDHHELVRDGTEEFPGHVNPLLDDLPGTDVSGAGAAFLVARALDPRNDDLLPMALVGAAADLQDREHGAFQGSNAQLVEDAVKAGLVQAKTDIALYGTQSRPLRNFFAYATEYNLPGMHRRGTEKLCMDLDIPMEPEPTWSELTDEQQRSLLNAIANRVMDCGGTKDDVQKLTRTVITLNDEPKGPTRELQEFGTLLNSTARYDRPDIGIAVVRGNRTDAFAECLDLLKGHRRHLAGALEEVGKAGVTELDHVQHVHLQDNVRDTVVGIVCGMALDALSLNKQKALIGFAHTPDGRTKVSSRAPAPLQNRGVDLAIAMREASAQFDGIGGGHKGAAGATIPRGTEEAFVAKVDEILAKQLQ
ncbi:MAG: DHHA1 domain-containing protein [Thermoplasmatota archaeon]